MMNSFGNWDRRAGAGGIEISFPSVSVSVKMGSFLLALKVQSKTNVCISDQSSSITYLSQRWSWA